MNSRHEKRIDPPPLNRIPVTDLERMKRDGLENLYAPTQAEARTLETVFRRVWDLFYDDFVKNGSPIVSVFFTWDGDTSTGDFGPPNDAICCCWEDHAAIGIEQTAFSHEDPENYLALLLLHELAHLRVKDDHTAEFENDLNYLLSEFNRTYRTVLANDFSGYSGSLKTDQRRADSLAIPAAWTKTAYRADGKTAAPRKKKRIDDSSQSARRAMIQRMKQQDKEAATAERAKIQKDYNGVRRS